MYFHSECRLRPHTREEPSMKPGNGILLPTITCFNKGGYYTQGVGAIVNIITKEGKPSKGLLTTQQVIADGLFYIISFGGRDLRHFGISRRDIYVEYGTPRSTLVPDGIAVIRLTEPFPDHPPLDVVRISNELLYIPKIGVQHWIDGTFYGRIRAELSYPVENEPNSWVLKDLQYFTQSIVQGYAGAPCLQQYGNKQLGVCAVLQGLVTGPQGGLLVRQIPDSILTTGEIGETGDVINLRLMRQLK